MSNISLQNRQPDLSSDTAIVELKVAVSSARDMRNALVTLALMITDKRDLQGYLVLLDPKLSKEFIAQELKALNAMLRQDTADRLHIVVAKAGKIVEGLNRAPKEDAEILHRAIGHYQDHRAILPKPNKRDEVFLAILHQWIIGQARITSRWIEGTVGCTYRTAAAAIERLGHALERHSDRSVSLKYFPEDAWRRFLPLAHETRSRLLYTDTSDQPRSPESILRRLNSMNRKDIAVGGVIGAKHYYKDLDIVGTPRLDLCIHCPGTRVDLEFVKKLDPALEQTRDIHRPSHLALHFIRRNDSLFEHGGDGSRWADPLECLVGLYDAHLGLQGRAFQEFLVKRRSELSD